MQNPVMRNGMSVFSHGTKGPNIDIAPVVYIRHSGSCVFSSHDCIIVWFIIWFQKQVPCLFCDACWTYSLICPSRSNQDQDTGIRVGDVFALMIEHWYGQRNAAQAYKLVEQMRSRNIVLGPYLDQRMVEDIYKVSWGVWHVNDVTEVKPDLFSHLRRWVLICPVTDSSKRRSSGQCLAEATTRMKDTWTRMSFRTTCLMLKMNDVLLVHPKYV